MGPREPETEPGSKPPAPRQEASVTSAEPYTARVGGKPGRLQNRRARLWLAISGGVLVMLCLGGVGVFVSLYDEATAIKRTAPDAAVDNFLGAFFVSRSESEIELYSCGSEGKFAELEAYRADIQSIEQRTGIGINVTWSTFTVEVGADQGTVTTDLTKETSDGRESLTRPWSFDVVNRDGWRVCGATETA